METRIMTGDTTTQNQLMVQGCLSMPSTAVPVLDIAQLREAVNFLRAGCPTAQLLAKCGWAGGTLGEKKQKEWFPKWIADNQQELKSFLNAVQLPHEKFSIEAVARAVEGMNKCIIVYTVTRKVEDA